MKKECTKDAVFIFVESASNFFQVLISSKCLEALWSTADIGTTKFPVNSLQLTLSRSYL